VSIFDGTKPIGTTTATADGTWSLQTQLKPGNHTFTESSTDLSGNVIVSDGATVFSQTAKQSLQGGTGNDFLIAGLNDKLAGGAGSDSFVFNAKLRQSHRFGLRRKS
jgi:Ca2+-binding RTX toxin-like protein